ncbi:Cytochrome P450 [Streptomyces sp. SceaMP-e96]|uniref:cytochrome P450 n=1 Tax=Streptomyces TaxID=1883 RepID=UPI000823C49C|nr:MULTISPECIES: cytochrome P450 [unclassified Streptomyces]MCW7988079.1 cytochrome P450 [Streptomyces platensis subsp. clarensis]MYT14125.1 cytochrome P450 [Streptomyces sp. SID4951]SCK58117.1 Cytochrome P450 [Streptomyces sp. SceaMP-e96]
MTNTQPLKAQPTVRSCPFDPPEEYRTLREQEPVAPVTFPDGSAGWLVTRYEDVRTVLGDPRFSTKHALRRPGGPGPDDAPAPQPGMFLMMDAPEHTRFRRLLTGQFTVRRMRQLTPAVERIVAEQLDAMATADGPVDLVQAFALPVPSLVICELLGVPYADREEFQRNSATIVRLDSSPEEFQQAQAAMRGFIHQLVLSKREKPTDDILSELVQSGELTDEELVGVGVLLLIAGHETTANMIALGTMCLLQNPEQLAALREDPSLMDNAVEELLRYLTIIQFGIRRVALEDLELNGRQIKEGSMVVASLASGNRDAAHLAGDPEALDVGRPHSAHLAFGHGIHQCLGQQLARAEMKAALSALLDRFPTLRLAVPVEEVPMRDDMLVYGVHELPVTW